MKKRIGALLLVAGIYLLHQSTGLAQTGKTVFRTRAYLTAVTFSQDGKILAFAAAATRRSDCGMLASKRK